jgi:hypothetical protein
MTCALSWIARQLAAGHPPCQPGRPGTRRPQRTIIRTGRWVVILTLAQLDRIGELRGHWSFLWDKRRSLWIAAEDCPDGEQFEEAELDLLLARLPVIDAECR